MVWLSAPCSPLLALDGGGDLGGFFRGNEFGDEGEAEVEGGAGAARSEDVAVEDDALVGEDGGEFVGDARVRGVAAADEQAGVVEDDGRGADGGEEFAGGVVAGDEFEHGGRGAEGGDAGAAGEQETIPRRRGGRSGRDGKIGEEEVGLDGDLVATDYAAHGAEGGEGDEATGAAEDVDGGDGFEFFKSLWQDDKDRGHGGQMKGNDAGMEGLATKSSADVKKTSEGRLAIFGAGYVGGALARRALAAGWSVTALTRNDATARELRALGCAVVVGDLSGSAWWDAPELAGGAERVAVTVAAGGGGAAGYQRSYVDGLNSVVGWGARLGTAAGVAGHLIYTSSTSVYPQDGGVRVTEADAAGGEAETTRALIEAERIAGDWPGVAATVLRLSGIYGPGRVHLVEQVRSGEVSGRADVHLNLVYRDDIVDAMEAAWERGAGRGGRGAEVYNVADEGAATKGEVVAWLAGRLAVPAPRFTGLPAGGRRAVTPDRVIDAARARAELGWRPAHATFREGYAKVLAEEIRFSG